MPKRSTHYSRVIQKTKWKPKLIKYKPNGKAVENIYIGTGNARRWIILKKKLEYRSDVDFVAFLLDLAEPFSNNDKSADEYEENKRNDDGDDDDEDDAEEKIPAELEDETNDSTNSAQPDIADDCEWTPAASHLEGALRRSPRTQTFPLKLHVRRSTRNIVTEDAADHKNKTQPKEAKKKEKKIKIDSYSGKHIILGPQRTNVDCSLLPDVLVSLEPLQSLPHSIGSCGDLQTSKLEETPGTNIDEDMACPTVDSSLVELATQEKSEWAGKVAEECVGNVESIVKLLDIPDPVVSTEGRTVSPLVTPGSEVHIEVGERVKLKRRKKRCHATQEAVQTSEENCDSVRGDHSHSSKRKRRKHKHGEHSTKKKNHDIRKAPQDGILTETTVPGTQSVMETDNCTTQATAQPSELGPKQTDSGEIEQDTLPTQVLQRVAIKIKLCSDCNHRHIQDACPLHNPVTVICDSIMFNDWQTQTFSNLKSEMDVSENYTCDDSITSGTNGLIDYGINKYHSVKSIENGENDTHIECSDAKRNGVDHSVIISPNCDGDSSHHLSCRAMSYEDETCDETSVPKYDSVKVKIEGSCTGDQDLISEKPSYARASLPAVLDIQTTDSGKELCVLARCPLGQYTQFGPLVGQIIKEKDIPDDFSMKHIWEVGPESERSYLSTMDADSSSWIRYVRPAPTRDLRNVVPVSRDGSLYLVTLVSIQEGEELLYWADDTTTSWARKKMEKTNCGGCNLRFTHPLYYRLHCTVFHDPNFSLTIRKYHCKVCGTAVLGKENIMKHAAEMHDGKGAYQCQYCKKFFLRLNYLEMHRTYGCASNPQRTRPLCDFCGRKFCQPQKLKVHIKRMHSDMADVLREFQCKICLKLLGSRAALQRHMKEVHHKDIVGACTCDRCGKMFQNKSNLKIHMLTHSGVKPFKCRESGCAAAFTTKQCLQFHYKKVHSFSDESMPVIERSVAYTFDAYSGGIVEDPGRGKSPRFDKERRNSSDNNSSSLLSLDDSSSASSLKADISGTSSATDCNTALEDKPCADQPPCLTPPSPPLGSEVTCQQPPMLEPYTSQSGYSFNNNKVLLSKGSKKWLGDAVTTLAEQDPPPEESEDAIRDVYDFEDNKECDVARRKPLVVFQRAESSNASLLVEAAIDAVERDMSGSCSAANSPTVIATCDMDCGNQYSVSVASAHQDSPQRHMESYNLHQPEELISPATSPDSGLHRQQHLSPDTSVSHMQHMDGYNSPHPLHRMDPYTVQHHEDLVSPAQTPRGHLVNNYEMMSPAGTPDNHGYGLHPHEELVSPAPTPTPRYELHHQVPNDNLSSGDEGEAQNLSLGLKGKSLQLDLAAYKQYEALEVVQEFGRGVERVGFEPLLVGGPTELQGLDMSARSGGYHPGFTTRYGVLYDERQTVDLSVAGRVYPPSPPYLHSVDLSLARTHPHSHAHHRGTPNHVVPDVSRTSVSQVLVDPGRMVSPPPHPTYQNYPMSPSPYHPASRPAHITSTSPTTYHHYSGYY